MTKTFTLVPCLVWYRIGLSGLSGSRASLVSQCHLIREYIIREYAEWTKDIKGINRTLLLLS